MDKGWKKLNRREIISGGRLGKKDEANEDIGGGICPGIEGTGRI